MVNTIKSSAKIKRNEESGFARIRRMENAVESGKKRSFSRMARPIGRLKLVEVR